MKTEKCEIYGVNYKTERPTGISPCAGCAAEFNVELCCKMPPCFAGGSSKKIWIYVEDK